MQQASLHRTEGRSSTHMTLPLAVAARGGAVPGAVLDAMAAALDVTPGIVAAVLARPREDAEPGWAGDAEAGRVAAALLRAGGETVPWLVRGVAAGPMAPLLRPAPPLLGGPEAARAALAVAYAARDWPAAAACLAALRPPEALATCAPHDLLRLAETAAALGAWDAALDLAGRIGPGRQHGLAALVAVRAQLGRGHPEAAWRALLTREAAELPARFVGLADAALRALGDLDRALALALSAGGAPGAALVAVVRALPAAGRTFEARALARMLWRRPLAGAVRVALMEARCALAPGGWPARAQARWAAWVERRALAGRAGPAEAVRVLVACRWHRPAWRVLDATGCEPGPATLLALVAGLVWGGALAEPAAVLDRAMAARADPATVAALRRHLDFVRGLAADGALPDGPRPATRLLLGVLPAPAVHCRRRGPRRLAHIATSFSVGGTERQLGVVAAGLAARHTRLEQHLLLSGEAGGDLLPAGPDGAAPRLHLHALRNMDAELPVGEALPGLAGLPAVTARVARLQRVQRYARLFRELRPDAVLAWKPEVAGLIGAVLAGVPRILLRNGSVAPTRRHWMREHQQMVAEFTAEGFRWLAEREQVRFVANSAAALADLTATLHWPPARSDVLYNAFDPTAFPPRDRAAARRRLGLPPRRVLVGGCFRLAPEKRPLLWLQVAEACLRHPAGRRLGFVVAGGGPLQPQLAAWIADRGLGGRVRLLGQLGPEVAEFHAATDLLLHTAAFEGLPNAVVEAQWAGTPVVAAAAGGVAEAFLPGVTGTLVESGTVTDLAGAVLRAVAALPAYAARRPAFRDFVTGRFSLPACLNRLDAALALAR